MKKSKVIEHYMNSCEISWLSFIYQKTKFNFAAACYTTSPYPYPCSPSHIYFYGTLRINHAMRSPPQKKNKCTLHLTFTWLWILKQNVSFHTGSLQFLTVLVRTVSGEAVGKDRLT